jgi:hypothetical protein
MGDPITAVVAVALITLLCDGKKKQREHDRPLSATGFSQVVPGRHVRCVFPSPSRVPGGDPRNHGSRTDPQDPLRP